MRSGHTKRSDSVRRPCSIEIPRALFPSYCRRSSIPRTGKSDASVTTAAFAGTTTGVNVTHVLAEDYIAFEETGDGLWDVHFGPVVIGRFHEPLLRIEDAFGKLARSRNRPAPVLPMSLD